MTIQVYLVCAGRLASEPAEEGYRLLRRLLKHTMTHIEDVFPRARLLKTPFHISPNHLLHQDHYCCI